MDTVRDFVVDPVQVAVVRTADEPETQGGTGDRRGKSSGLASLITSRLVVGPWGYCGENYRSQRISALLPLRCDEWGPVLATGPH